jgi:hypothetical protein
MATPVNVRPDREEMQAVAALFAIQEEVAILEDSIKTGKDYNAEGGIGDVSAAVSFLNLP